MQFAVQLAGQLLAANRREQVAFVVAAIVPVCYFRTAEIASFRPWAVSGSWLNFRVV